MSSSFYNIGDWILTNQTITWGGANYVGGEFQVLVGSSPILACVSTNSYGKTLMLCSEQPFSIKYTVAASYTPEEHEVSSYDTFSYGSNSSSGSSYGSSSYGSSSYGSSSYGGGSSYGSSSYGSGTTYYYVYLDSLYTNNGTCYITSFDQPSSWFTSSYDMGAESTGVAMIDEKGGPYVPPGPSVAGEATVDLEIQAPGQRLTFTSKELGTSVTVQVTGDTTVMLEGGETVGIILEGGKGDEIEIYNGSILLQTVTFGTNDITASTNVPINKALTFVSTKFSYGDNNAYFSKTITITTAGVKVKVMPDGALYWYGNECEDITGGWNVYPVGHYSLTDSRFNCFTPTLIKNKNSIYAGWNVNEMQNVINNKYNSGCLLTINTISHNYSIVKIHAVRSESVKQNSSSWGIVADFITATAHSGFSGGGNISYSPALHSDGQSPSNTVLINQLFEGNTSGSGRYYGYMASVSKIENCNIYCNIEIDYFVLE